MITPKYDDVHSKYNGGGYNVTNEEPELINGMLGNTKFKRIAGIASGSEIALQCLLPRTQEALVCVDHGYTAIAASYLKVLLLQQMGAKQFQELLLTEQYGPLVAAVQALDENLVPPALRNANTSSGWRSALNQSTFQTMRREWAYTPYKVVDESLKRLDRLHFIHGDLQDLKPYAPFDLLYLSNALEHTGRDKTAPNIAKLAELLPIGGLILHSTSFASKQFTDFKNVRFVKGLRTSWYFGLMRKVANAAAKPEKATTPQVSITFDASSS